MKLIIVVTLLFAAITLVAQQADQAQPVPRYDISKEIAVKGSVQNVTQYQCPVSGTLGAHLGVLTKEELLEVHVAPSRFLREFEIAFNPGDEVQMVGNRFEYGGKIAFVPRSITVKKNTYFFRNQKGSPVW